MKKKCSYCKIEQDISQFFKEKRRKDGYGYRCRSCNKKQMLIRYREQTSTPEGRAKLRREGYFRNSLWKYGVGKKEFEILMTNQDGICPLCLDPLGRKVDIDHNHSTGEVRGLLCHRCNTMIGFVREDISILKRSITYLSK